ncbi:hypothetical protein ACFOD4_19055 [Pseudoroseomonas globiformis]|uniref:Uncharacterized protein n=1 Tax=Teichococcus globiformis TaxID=2307229 RepID=A0ABV7G384_9PROT
MQENHGLCGARSRRWLNVTGFLLAFLGLLALAIALGFSIGLLAITEGGNLIAFCLFAPAMLLWLRSILKGRQVAGDL